MHTDEGVDSETFVLIVSIKLTSLVGLLSIVLLCTFTMRVKNKIHLSKLFGLKLDQQSFGLAKELMATTEKLKSAEQTVIFLKRCLKENITPVTFRQPCRIPQDLPACAGIGRLQTHLAKKLIRISIRRKYQEITGLKESTKYLRETLSSDVLNQLMTEVSTDAKRMKKDALIRKFNLLRRTKRNHSQVRKVEPEEIGATQTNRERISIIGDIYVPEAAIDAFSRGPNFAIRPKFSHENLQRRTQVEVAALAYAMRWRAACTSDQHRADPDATEGTNTAHRKTEDSTDEELEQGPTNLSKQCPFKPKRIAPPRTDIATESAIKGFQRDMERIVSRARINAPQNITPAQRNSIKELASRNDITVTRSDKGGEIVIMPSEKLHSLTMEHLGDTTTYQRLVKDPTPALRLTVNKTFQYILKLRGLSPTLIKRLQTPPSTKTQQFYTLPKTHKQTLKIRPIVSGRNGIFDRLGWFLQTLLKPLLKKVDAHISSTAKLIERFKECPQSKLKEMIPISFDVISLYTNIDVEEAISTALQYTRKHDIHLYGLTTGDLNELLHLILENNIFEYTGHGFFKQIRGLAMGSRLSGTLAILAMDRFERLHIYPTIQPTLYVRYVDDAGTVVKCTAQAERMLNHLNSRHKSIKFELELPSVDGYLPILDTAIKIKPDGSLSYKLHTKKASKQITLHKDSHHPSTTKNAIVNSEIQRAIRNSSPDNMTDAIESITHKLINNGYPTGSIQRAIRNNCKNKPRRSTHRKTSKLTFQIPFVNDQFDKQVKRALQRHHIDARVVHPGPQTLLQLAKPRTKPPGCSLRSCPIPHLNCTTTFVVYEVKCLICKEIYIGSTTRALHQRAKEHLAAAKKHDESSALGVHYRIQHVTDPPQLEFRIVRLTKKDELRLRIEEAIAIKKLLPAINRRIEDTGVDFLA